MLKINIHKAVFFTALLFRVVLYAEPTSDSLRAIVPNRERIPVSIAHVPASNFSNAMASALTVCSVSTVVVIAGVSWGLTLGSSSTVPESHQQSAAIASGQLVSATLLSFIGLAGIIKSTIMLQRTRSAILYGASNAA